MAVVVRAAPAAAAAPRFVFAAAPAPGDRENSASRSTERQEGFVGVADDARGICARAAAIALAALPAIASRGLANLGAASHRTAPSRAE